MKLVKGFLCASTAALVLAFCGCKKDSKSDSSGGDSSKSSESSAFAGKFSPKVHEDAEIALGLNLDLQKLAKIGMGFIDQGIAMVDEENQKTLREVKEEYEKFVKDPFKGAHPDLLGFVEEVGLRNAKVGWAVASVESIAFENGSPLPETVPGTALAIATDVDIEKIVAYANREAANAGFSIAEGTLAGKKAWNFLPKDEDDKRQFREKQLYPCFTSLDGQLVLIASSPSMLTKQIRLYLEGKGEGQLLREFTPADGDLVRLAVKDLGAILRTLPSREQKKINVPMVQNGNELVLGLKDVNLALTAKSNRAVAFSLKLRTASAEDAGNLRDLLKMFVSMAENPDAGMPKPVADTIKRAKVAGSGDVLEAGLDDILAVVAGVAVPNFLKYRRDSQTAACIGNMQQLRTAGESFLTKHPGTAPTLGDLCGPEDTKYLRTTPTCPKDHSSYTITLEDGAINVKCGSGDPEHVLPKD